MDKRVLRLTSYFRIELQDPIRTEKEIRSSCPLSLVKATSFHLPTLNS